MKKALIALSFLAMPARAQSYWFNAQLEFRVDYNTQFLDGTKTDAGFRGKYLNLKLNGKISDKFSYAYRQRFSKDMLNLGGFFNATDYLYLNYRPIQDLNIQAGKQFVWIGGNEYDKAPIDVYQYTEYCQFIECYGYGVSVDYNLTPHDNLLVQVAQSAFTGHQLKDDGSKENPFDRYSYNMKWTGHHGCFSSIYSFGVHEYKSEIGKRDKRYLSCFALGNRFDFGRVSILADYTNRSDLSKTYKQVTGVNTTTAKNVFGDFSAMTELHVKPLDELNVWGHYSHAHNESNYGDPTVKPGTSLNTVGAGVEYFPLKGDSDIRLHAAYFYNFGENGNPDGVLLDDQHYFTAGLTFRLNYQKIKERYKARKTR